MYLPIGADYIPISGGSTWVDQWLQASSALGERRGVRPGKRITLSTGAIGYVPFVPKATCADVLKMLARWGAPMLMKMGLSLSFNPYARALTKMVKDFASICGSNATQEFPQNDLFWILTKRLALELDSRKAVPNDWELIVESVKESAEEFLTDLPGVTDIVPTFDLRNMLLLSLGGVGLYMVLKRR